MANYDLQAILRHNSNLSQNDVVNTYHFSINAPDTLEGAMDELASIYVGKQNIFPPAYNKLTIKGYPAGLNPSGPERTEDYTFAGTGAAGPGEMALCLSYATVDDPEASTPRRRGRVYIGPIQGGALAERPHVNFRNDVLAMGVAIGAIGTAGNTTWMLKSATDNSYHKIEVCWVDDAWDVQRRRGLDPTLRSTADVQ